MAELGEVGSSKNVENETGDGGQFTGRYISLIIHITCVLSSHFNGAILVCLEICTFVWRSSLVLSNYEANSMPGGR